MKKMEGAKEVDIVYSGLEEMMLQATRENWAYATKHDLTLREACIGNALEKLSDHYKSSGMMI